MSCANRRRSASAPHLTHPARSEKGGDLVFRDAASSLDYRIPDLTFVATARLHVLRSDGVRGEGPDAVIEIRSPKDETCDQRPFYAALRVRDVIVCGLDTKEPELFRPAGAQYVAVQRDPDGWLVSDALSIRLRRVNETPARLRLEDLMDRSVGVEI